MLVVAGKSDIATKLEANKHISLKVPRGELQVLSPRGQMALMERNQQFSDIVRDFSNSCLSLKSFDSITE